MAGSTLPPIRNGDVIDNFSSPSILKRLVMYTVIHKNVPLYFGLYFLRFLRPVHTSNIVEATFDFVASNGNTVERVYRKISSSRQSRMLLRHCCRFGNNVAGAACLQFVSTLSIGRNFVRHCCRNWQHCCQKRQKCRSNSRHCRKNRSTCCIRQCCLDIAVGMDGASVDFFYTFCTNRNKNEYSTEQPVSRPTIAISP